MVQETDVVRKNIEDWIEAIARKYQFEGKQILEVGAGTLSTNEMLFGGKNTFTRTEIYEGAGIDKILDITKVDWQNFKPISFDLIIMSEVLEHVYETRQALANCGKLLKRHGLLLITMPWEYPEHGEDYWRISERAIDLLLSEAGFEVVAAGHGLDGGRKTNIFRLAKNL